MWKQPWGYKEGFVISAGLIITGIILQINIGEFQIDVLKFPVNLITGVLYIFLLVGLFFLSKKKKTLRWFSEMQASITAIISFLLLVVIMGLTRQELQPVADAAVFRKLGFTRMTSSWAFTLMFLYFTTVLGLVTAKRISKFKIRNDIPFILNHLGLFITLFAAVLSSPDMMRLDMIVTKGQPEWRAADEKGKIIELPLAIDLNNFTIDEYPPKLMLIDNANGKALPEKRPENILVETIPVKGNLPEWDINVVKKIENSAPVITKDSVRFVEFHSEGAAASVFVKAKNLKTGSRTEGWVSAGSYMFPYHALKLDDKVSLIMPDREPKRFASDVHVYTKDGYNTHAVVEVNKPLKVKGWKIYQVSYDERMGKWSNTSKFELVKDPWIGWVYAGIIMMVCGAIGLFVFGKKTAP